jgi:beta-lactamase class A
MTITRRTLMLGAGGALAIGQSQAGETHAFGGTGLKTSLDALERRSGGRLGVAVIDAGSGRRFAHRGDERFPMCSTFKFLLAAAVLAKVDKGTERLDRPIPVRAGDIITYSPTTEKFVGREASVAVLCEAAVTLSDNAAANLLLPLVDGPPGLTAFARSIGDDVTRLDRNEPTLNESTPGDPRDTTTPNAMAADLQRLVLGEALSEGSRRQLTDWLVACKTGDARIRAGLPSGWRVGDKTGTGARGSANDIAVLWPPRGGPLLVASYLTETTLESAAANAIHAAVGQAVSAALDV